LCLPGKVALLALLHSCLGSAVAKGFEIPFLDSSQAGNKMNMPVAGMVTVLCRGKGDVGVKPLLKGEHRLFGYLPEVEVFAGILLLCVRAYNDAEKVTMRKKTEPFLASSIFGRRRVC
jgi:hypothetical protein